ncbi:MAG: hypothetical protein M1818_007922 [Claussenomyces sp. TS43310]|nr:MAG: hypothetical protein M1818_007922 [Claussenomyces sp. TS43310]
MYTTSRPQSRNVLKAIVNISCTFSSRAAVDEVTKNTTACSGLEHLGQRPRVSEAEKVAEVESAGEAKQQQTLATMKKRTIAESDEELRLKLEGVSGEGGTAGVEYENGKAVAMRRGVKQNMFRLI